jgi:DNA-binding NarL/FixJ family response regulator
MVGDGGAYIAFDEARAETNWVGQDGDAHRAHAGVSAKVEGFIAIVENRTFVRECILHSMQSAFSLPVVGCSTVWELEPLLHDASAKVVILSLMDASRQECASALQVCMEFVPSVPIVVLGSANDVALAAIRHGARGYIPCTMGFEIAVEAVRFVLAGGTYVPMDRLAAPEPPKPLGVFTSRELAVVKAIQQGKPNKIIAYELNMAESTVKVHVRNIMRKLKAKNRTDVAIKAQNAFRPP